MIKTIIILLEFLILDFKQPEFIIIQIKDINRKHLLKCQTTLRPDDQHLVPFRNILENTLI